jgi:hypothetical protein
MIKLKLRGDAPAMTWTNAEVEALVSERDKLRAALKQIASIPDFDESEDVVWTDTAIALATARQIASRALEETK